MAAFIVIVIVIVSIAVVVVSSCNFGRSTIRSLSDRTVVLLVRSSVGVRASVGGIVIVLR